MARPSSKTITISGIDVLVQRKKIKNVHLVIYPPDGRVRISVPLHISDRSVQTILTNRLPWIQQKQTQIQSQKQVTQPRLINDETLLFLGENYRLEVIHKNGRGKVQLKDKQVIQLTIKADASKSDRQRAIDNFYRAELKMRIPKLINKWQPIIGKQVDEWRIKKMKTRWGSCNMRARRIWLNLELAKQPPECLEYVIVHEMTHLLERYHNRAFYGYMDKFLPDWRKPRDILKRSSFAID
jgi:predicted metal-dependent hydrolase